MKARLYSHFFSAILIICISLNNFNAFGQFEQKLTINGSIAFVYPDMLEDYSSYGNGFGFDGGLQYNFSRNFSFYGATRFYYMFGAESYEDAYYDNLAIGGGIKLNMLPAKRINPYLFAEANINFIWLEEWIYPTGFDDGYYDSDFGTAIGGLGGLGFDFRLNDNFAIFAQSGTYYTFWDNRINLYSQLGLRINMIKSKTI